ncbi:MAG: 2,3-bisphosphoglycerate-independent phosphoglycerate mutase, partial [Alphaproteobacteria bacterium]
MSQAPVGLIILDGWGVRGEAAFNAPALARTPHFDAMMARFPTARLAASGVDVGLPEGQIGNSEVGHLNIGSGRVVMQTLPRITAAFASGEAAENRAILDFVAEAKAGTGRVHLLGLLSPGGVHAHQDHLGQLASLLSGHGLDVRVHAFADGRDVPPTTLPDDLQAFRRAYPGVKIASLQGRYWAMDRDQRWERTGRAFAALCRGEGEAVADLDAAIAAAHAGGTSDEFLDPMITDDFVAMEDGDALACFNFRADRVRQILNALLLPDFDGFDVSARPRFASALGMTAYSDALAAHLHVAFAPQPLPDTLGQVLAAAGLQQTRLAETEKYPHVTFFFNGGIEAPNPGEHRILVPSPKVATYDLQPE